MTIELDNEEFTGDIPGEKRYISIPCRCREQIKTTGEPSELIFVECHHCGTAIMVATDCDGNIAEIWIRHNQSVICNVAKSVYFDRG